MPNLADILNMLGVMRGNSRSPFVRPPMGNDLPEDGGYTGDVRPNYAVPPPQDFEQHYDVPPVKAPLETVTLPATPQSELFQIPPVYVAPDSGPMAPAVSAASMSNPSSLAKLPSINSAIRTVSSLPAVPAAGTVSIPAVSPAVSPQLSAAENLRRAIETAEKYRTMSPKELDTNHDNPFMNLGKGALLGLDKIRPFLLNGGGDDMSAVKRGLGAVVGGAAGGATYAPYSDEQAQLDELRGKADANVTAAGKIANDANQTAVGQAQIDDLLSKDAARRSATETAKDKLQATVYANATKRLRAYNEGIKTGVLSHDNDAILKSMEDIVGGPVKLDSFDPNKDTIVNSKIIEDAAGNRAFQVTVNREGKTTVETIKDPVTGGNAFIKDPRVASSEIQAGASKYRTDVDAKTDALRIASQEKIAQMGLNAKQMEVATQLYKTAVESVAFTAQVMALDEADRPQVYDNAMNKAIEQARGEIKP